MMSVGWETLLPGMIIGRNLLCTTCRTVYRGNRYPVCLNNTQGHLISDKCFAIFKVEVRSIYGCASYIIRTIGILLLDPSRAMSSSSEKQTVLRAKMAALQAELDAEMKREEERSKKARDIRVPATPSPSMCIGPTCSSTNTKGDPI